MRGMAKTDRGDSSVSQMPGCGPQKEKIQRNSARPSKIISLAK